MLKLLQPARRGEFLDALNTIVRTITTNPPQVASIRARR